MEKIIVKAGQSLLDIAVQEYGAAEAAIHLAIKNGIKLTATLQGGQELNPIDMVFNLPIEQYCKSHDVSPATA